MLAGELAFEHCETSRRSLETGQAPRDWKAGGRSSHRLGCGFDEPSKSSQHPDFVVKIRQTHMAADETKQGSNWTLCARLPYLPPACFQTQHRICYVLQGPFYSVSVSKVKQNLFSSPRR